MKDGIGYRGIVTLKLKKGKKKPYKTMVVHNSGTPELFRLLCNAVMGNNMASYMPQYLGVYDTNGDALSSIRPHWETVSVQQELGKYYTKFDFIIPGSYITSNNSIGELRLYNSTIADVDSFLASLKISENITVSPDSNLYISWNMYFDNQAEL